MYNVSICLSDIPKEKIQISEKNGKMYVNLVVADKREVDQYGYDATVYVNQTKEEREAGEARQYCGRGKKVEFKNNFTTPETHPFEGHQVAPQQPQPDIPSTPVDDSDLPF